MKTNELRPMRIRSSASRPRVDDRLVLPSYLQRYADEHEAWHAHRRDAGQKIGGERGSPTTPTPTRIALCK